MGVPCKTHHVSSPHHHHYHRLRLQYLKKNRWKHQCHRVMRFLPHQRISSSVESRSSVDREKRYNKIKYQSWKKLFCSFFSSSCSLTFASSYPIPRKEIPLLLFPSFPPRVNVKEAAAGTTLIFSYLQAKRFPSGRKRRMRPKRQHDTPRGSQDR